MLYTHKISLLTTHGHLKLSKQKHLARPCLPTLDLSAWVCARDDSLYVLRDNVHIWMYPSTVPCGGTSMGILAATQDPEVSARMDAIVRPFPSPDLPRGREGYARLRVLRTKPSRADAPRVLSMSYDDKIARWSVLGIQSALASLILAPVYIYVIVIGEVDAGPGPNGLDRAFCARLGDLEGLTKTLHRRTELPVDRMDCNRIDVAVNLRPKRVS